MPPPRWGRLKIVQLDSEGVEREIWTLNNAWFKDVKFGDLDYSSEDMLNVEVTLKYDNATLRSSGGTNETTLSSSFRIVCVIIKNMRGMYVAK